MLQKNNERREGALHGDAALTNLSASEMARRIAEGLLSSQEFVEAHIRRIEADSMRLNAVVVPWLSPWSPPDVAQAVRLSVRLVGADGLATQKRTLGHERRDQRVGSVLTLSTLPGGLRSLLATLLRQTGQSYQAYALQTIPGKLSVDTYWQLVEEQHDYRARFLGALDAGRFEAILCPPHALPALTHGSSGTLNVSNAASYAMLYNLLGMPAGVAPITRVQEGEESERQVGRDSVERAAD